MKGRLEELLLGPASSNRQRERKIQKSKAKARRRTREKYGEGEREGGEATRTANAEPALQSAVESPATARAVELRMAQTASQPPHDAGLMGAMSSPSLASPAVKAVRRRRGAAQSAVEAV